MPKNSAIGNDPFVKLTNKFEKLVDDLRNPSDANTKLKSEEMSAYLLMLKTYSQFNFKNVDIRDAKNALKAGDTERFLELFDQMKEDQAHRFTNEKDKNKNGILNDLKNKITLQHGIITEILLEMGQLKNEKNVIYNQLHENLINQLIHHFESEKEYMKILKYPKIDSHIADHMKYLKEAKNKSLPGLINDFLAHAHSYDKDINL